ncbi:cap-specific mRNA (nucleoside-2'-O-)-methyltransferase 2 [Pelodytes ibericus]
MSRCDVPAQIQSLFSKRYDYVKEKEWLLPDVSEAYSCEHEEFSDLLSYKDSLNKVKNLLSDKKLDDWHQHTSFTNKAGKIVPEVRRSANAELCTQAWCKFYEIVCTYPLLPKEALWNHELNTIHLCEAPGAFIASLNHYLKTQDLHCDWSWVANTLNPYHEANDGLVMIADDRLIANTLPWWFFGPDNNGDIMRLKHLTGLQHFISNMSAVHLVTADGSFDCQGNPGEQEALVSPLHYCEVVTCLLTLTQGGSFVLKMFTLFEHSSVNLMYLLNCCFQEVHVIKPGTSKAGNSEVYVVCLAYLGKEVIEDFLLIMIQNFGSEIVSKSLFPRKSLPASFLRRHQECCNFFCAHQIQTIQENLQLFACMGEQEKSQLNAVRDYAVSYYIKHFQVRRIPRKQWIVRKPGIGCSVSSRWAGGRACRSDTYNERKHLESLTWPEKVSAGYFSPWVNEHVKGNMGADCLLEGSYEDLNPNQWFLLEGSRLPRIQSSPFCDGELLKRLNETIEGCLKGCPEDVSLRCPSCRTLSAEDIRLELLHLTGSSQRVLVIGSLSLSQLLNAEWAPSPTPEPALPSISVLHDGERAYQKQLVDWVLHAVQQLEDGDSLVLPVLSVFTRLSAGMVYLLHHCFQVISFACPTSGLAPGADALLLCCGFRALPDSVIQCLLQLQERTDALGSPGSPQQVLEFIPMETLLDGSLLDFLWALNSAIIKYKLHVIGHQETNKQENLQTQPFHSK